MNKWTIYCHRNKLNNKCYIGQTKEQPYTKRWTNHAPVKAYRGCRLFQKAIEKYGWENFEHFAIIENIPSQELANQLEYLLIQCFKTNQSNFGYNLAPGGGCTGMNDETKALIKLHHADFSGVNHPRYGQHLSEETKNKISQSRKGQLLTESTKQKISVATKGEKNPRAKAVICINTGQEFPTAKSAAEWIGQKDGSHIGKCCRGQLKTCGKHPISGEPLQWKYKN